MEDTETHVDEGATVTQKVPSVRGRVGGQASDDHVMVWCWEDPPSTEHRLATPRRQPDDKSTVRYGVVHSVKRPGQRGWERIPESVTCTGTVTSFAQCVREIVPHVPD